MHSPENERSHMHMALLQAQKAANNEEVPVGAVIVDSAGTIVARGHNQVEKKGQQTAHAEVVAIERACKKLGDWRLEGHVLYVTLEPCVMCIGLVGLVRLQRVVFGARSKLFGHQLDRQGKFPLYKKDIQISEGVLAVEAAQVLQQFFKRKRK